LKNPPGNVDIAMVTITKNIINRILPKTENLEKFSKKLLGLLVFLVSGNDKRTIRYKKAKTAKIIVKTNEYPKYL
jgi:hypothetical protein